MFSRLSEEGVRFRPAVVFVRVEKGMKRFVIIQQRHLGVDALREIESVRLALG